MPKLSIIILSYNTIEITKNCLQKLTQSLSIYPSFETEIIVVDNASIDGSQEMLQEFKDEQKSKHISVLTICNQHNEGYPKGNNQGLHNASGEYILFLNSDVYVDKVNWPELVAYMENNQQVGGLTVRVEFPSGKIDPASHRGFPTVWNSFSYYSKLEALTKNIPLLSDIFGGYHLTSQELDTVHEIDSPTGAFYLSRKDILEKLDGFDESFFMYGEDIDLSYRLKERGYAIVYYPEYTVEHLKYQSGLKSDKAQLRTKRYFYDAMRIFYRKHYEEKYPWIVNQIVYFFIDLKSKL